MNKPVLIIIFFAATIALQAQTELESDTAIYNYCDEMPEFPGGNTKLFAYIAKNISFPECEKDSEFTGSYYVRFVVEKNGNVSNANILKGGDKCKSSDKSILDVINSLPAFSPGRNNGKPVRVAMTFPIRLCPLR